jgi:hypothetical protein
MLELPNPIVREATPAKEFRGMWLYNVNIHAPGPSYEATSRVEIIPMASDGELHWAAAFPVETHHFMRAVREVPEVGLAYQYTLAAVEPLMAFIEKVRLEELAALQQQGGD